MVSYKRRWQLLLTMNDLYIVIGIFAIYKIRANTNFVPPRSSLATAPYRYQNF